MGVLSQLEPKGVFGFFETICSIPHGSGNTDAIAEYIVSFAAERGFECSRDEANNVLVTVPASAGREGDETIILQAHTDMVCEKDEGVDFDFAKDALRLVVDGDTLRAELELLELSIGGLRSGHSGVEIDKGRANSNVLMARLLRELAAKADIRLVGLEGGARETAIAASTVAVVGAASGADALAALAEEFGAQLRREYATAEPDMSVSAAVSGKRSVDALTAADTARALALLQALPDGVQAMSVDMPGLVQTSLNFGLVKLRDAELWCANTVRSSMTSQKQWILDKICAAAELAGGSTEISGSYPGWSYNPRSAVKEAILNAYRELFGREASVEAVHAGIECGLFADSIPELDCVSIGPDMADVHTPREHLSISSAARTYELLKAVLA